MNKLLGAIILMAFITLTAGNAQNKKPATKSKEKTEQVKTVKIETGDKIISNKNGPDGQPVYEGPKGGLYYMNKSGNKTYLKDTDSVLPDKKGPEGQPVYKGSQGGEYYYNKSGAKAYLKGK